MRIISLASIPDRQAQLKKTVMSLLIQCDKMNVALNGYKEIPSFLNRNNKISAYLSDNSMGDAEKFRNIGEGYNFTCDDDLIYPGNYIQTLINKIDQYKCIISCHGRNYNYPAASFKKSKNTRFRL